MDKAFAESDRRLAEFRVEVKQDFDKIDVKLTGIDGRITNLEKEVKYFSLKTVAAVASAVGVIIFVILEFDKLLDIVQRLTS